MTITIEDVPIKHGETHTYYLLSASQYWTDSEAGAVSLGGHLVTINDAAENAWVRTAFPASPYQNLWIGLNDAAVEGTFVWVSGETATYRNWQPGEPNNSGGNEDYTQMYALGKWNDRPNGGLDLYGVVEIPTAKAVPETGSTLPLLGLAITALATVRKPIYR